MDLLVPFFYIYLGFFCLKTNPLCASPLHYPQTDIYLYGALASPFRPLYKLLLRLHLLQIAHKDIDFIVEKYGYGE